MSNEKEPEIYIIVNGIDGNLLDFLHLIDGFINDMPDDYLMITSIYNEIKLSIYFSKTNKQYEGAQALKHIIDFRRKQLSLMI